VDRDGDGKISREEFPGPAEIFQRFDTNKDGFIDAKEREAMRASRRQGRVGRGNNGGFAMQEFFRALDTDLNRQVSPKEWELLLMAADFKAADADKNGKVSPEEWFRYMGQGNRPERGPAQGDAAPKVTAKSVTDSKPVDLAKVTRPTVLIFGSYT
jgi:Ca2+-binding EF-hand superfamily protein